MAHRNLVMPSDRDGDTMPRCEDERIHLPDAVQGFGALIALVHTEGSRAHPVCVASENSARIVGKSPSELFALENFMDIFSTDQANCLLDHIDLLKNIDTDGVATGPDVFALNLEIGQEHSRTLWCAIHQNQANQGLIICEFEMEDDQIYPVLSSRQGTTHALGDMFDRSSIPRPLHGTTENHSRHVRTVSSARKQRGAGAAMDILNVMSKTQERFGAASSLEKLLEELVDIVKETTDFHRVMVHRFDQPFNGQVAAELVDPGIDKIIHQGPSFAASDILKQAKELHRINGVRVLLDRDLETARLVYRTIEDSEPLDLTDSFLRAEPPTHLKRLTNMGVRSSISISMKSPTNLWGLITCHLYGSHGKRIPFPSRKILQFIGDAASTNIERLSNESRLQAWKVVSHALAQNKLKSVQTTSSEELLKLFQADSRLLSSNEQMKLLDHVKPQETLALLKYLETHDIRLVTASVDIVQDFPNLLYPPGFDDIAGVLVVPLSVGSSDFLVFSRKARSKEIKRAGNPYETLQGARADFSEPRENTEICSETVTRTCDEWSEEEVETAVVIRLICKKHSQDWEENKTHHAATI